MNPKRTLLLLALCLVPCLVFSQLYTFKLFNRSEGLATQAINCSTQDKNGYLYLGTDGAGIMRYDGYRFENFEDKDLNAPLHVSKIEVIEDEVYFSTLYNGVCAYYNDYYHSIYNPKDNSGETYSLSNINQNIGVFCAYKIALITKSGKELFKMRFPKNQKLIYYQILSIPNGTIAFTNQGNYVLTEKNLVKLSTHLNSKSLDNAVAGCFCKNQLVFYLPKSGIGFRFNIEKDGTFIQGTKFEIPASFFEAQGNDKYFATGNRLFHLGNLKKLDYLENGTIKAIAPNYSFNSGVLNHITVDRSRTTWVSSTQGLIKVSLEPFTQIELNPVYSNHEIGFVFRDQSKYVYTSTYGGICYVSRIGQNKQIQYRDLVLYGACNTPIGTILGTNKGLYIRKGDHIEKWHIQATGTNKIRSIYYANNSLYFCPEGADLHIYNLETKKLSQYSLSDINSASHIYVIKQLKGSNSLYLGTNNGLVSFDLKRKKFKYIGEFNALGAYVGTGVEDSYGNLWFSFDRGLGCITRKEEKVILKDINILKSVLTYTLNSDRYGKIYVGSNIGINVIKVNENGKALHAQLYAHNNGFTGYETNMRAAFQDEKFIYVGTVNGLYSINTDLLNNVPPPYAPIIFKGRLSPNGVIINDDKDRFLSFRNILPRNNGLTYSYRILGVNENWSKPSSSPELILPKLENGLYTVEVRSSYDKIHFSPISSYPLRIEHPLWQSKWFIVILIVLLGFGNILYIEWTSSGLTSRLGDFNHEAIDAKFLPKLLLFGTVILILTCVIEANLIDEAFSNITLNIITCALMVSSYLTSYILFSRTQGGVYLKYVFYFGLAVIASHFYIMLYRSHVHPYPLIAILLISTVIPYTITALRTIIVICVIQVTISISILLAIDKTIYNEFLYITAIVVSAALTILITYLRNDSLEKLIFVSNILNRGEMIVIAFDQQGNISYISKNITEFLNVDTALLVGKPLATLNPLVVTQEMRELSLSEEFRDGKVFLVPMYNKATHVVWLEFSCKEFSSDVKVIIGRDVTEKLTISTNYQSLVENAQDMIFNTDINGNFVYLNEMSSRVFGFRNENMVGQNSATIIHPDYRKTVQEFYQNQFKNRIKHTYLEFPIRTKEGRIIWLGQNATMTFEPGSRKRVSGFIALARDITEKRANELLIEQQNKDITESINSAKRIQFNLLPKASVLNKHFEDSFLMYRPKDIVSGDFYWFHEEGDSFYVALADCTGHGIPGAFMTIMGMNLLNILVVERKLNKPSEILNALHNELDKLLHAETGSGLPEGMQLILCYFEKNTLKFASSGVSLVVLNEHKFDHFRSTRNEGNLENYECQFIQLEKDDQIYLITDGYQKQFGSIRNKKFSFKRIRELLEKISKEKMPLQKKYFENTWRNWSEGHEQTDDISIIGVKNFKDSVSPKSEQE